MAPHELEIFVRAHANHDWDQNHVAFFLNALRIGRFK
ncbi:hypothetical protein ES706_00348 [subsurface metagenome]